MWGRSLAFALALLALAGCGTKTASPAAPAVFHVTSPQVTNGVFPKSATCDGGDHRPSLMWTSAPTSTKGFVIELLDSDVPGGTFTHWLLYNIPAGTKAVGGSLPKGSVQGYNEFGKRAYNGPCPPAGPSHHYHFYVIALDTDVHINGAVDRYNLEAAMENHIIGRAELAATYKR